MFLGEYVLSVGWGALLVSVEAAVSSIAPDKGVDGAHAGAYLCALAVGQWQLIKIMRAR